MPFCVTGTSEAQIYLSEQKMRGRACSVFDGVLERCGRRLQFSLLMQNAADFVMRPSIFGPRGGCFLRCLERFIEARLAIKKQRVVHTRVEVGKTTLAGRQRFEQ
jgi:hypothetical protein